MDIITTVHHAMISDHMKQRASRAVQRIALRVHAPIDATVRFEQDGPTRRVELLMHARQPARVVATGEHPRFFGPALVQALARLEAQLRSAKRPASKRRRPVTRA